MSANPDTLTIVIVEQDKRRALAIVDSLNVTGDYDIHVLDGERGLARSVADLAPDVVLIDVANPSRDTIEQLALASGPLDRPVALFVDRSDAQMTRTAIEAGVSAYVVDGLQNDRVKPVMDAAIARFQMFQRMRVELETTKRALEERKVIDRAKGLLMKMRGIDEEAAYALLRKTAMDQGKRVPDVARALVTAADLLT
ncbi:ANTAR domain-containing protein [Cognatishimia sp. SS12]|uniref:ANTAR domain-containing response regulator n=1 Tax=Cognatishimia sp. SS12 TaxID=2979465 RepID=UPI0023308702|nr:ANTAR domain-containing protein [Cognatishimia sp. SS12]MDC0738798.1 ANTAR domain-containing protein [Cognatishimia sp. SS12]